HVAGGAHRLPVVGGGHPARAYHRVSAGLVASGAWTARRCSGVRGAGGWRRARPHGAGVAPDGAALLDRLADAVASARYWQAPDEEDPQPADPGAVARLRSIADARRRRHGGGGPPRSTRARRRTCGGWAR